MMISWHIARDIAPFYFGAMVALVKVLADSLTDWLINRRK